MKEETPRRYDLLRAVEAEIAISKAVEEVEKLGADTKLTDAVVLLAKARDCVSDFVDSQKSVDLTDYLKNEKREGKNEFRLFVKEDNTFYIHPIGENGKTFDGKL